MLTAWPGSLRLHVEEMHWRTSADTSTPPASLSCRSGGFAELTHLPRVVRGTCGMTHLVSGRPTIVCCCPVWARASARRSASGSRNRPAIRRTRLAARVGGIPAALTNNGRAELPRRTSTAWLAVRNRVLAMPMTGTQRGHAHALPGPDDQQDQDRHSRR